MQGGYGPMAMPQQHHSHTSPFAMSGSSNIGASHANGGRYSENGGWGSALAQSRASATLWLGDLEAWMDESYVVRRRRGDRVQLTAASTAACRRCAGTATRPTRRTTSLSRSR